MRLLTRRDMFICGSALGILLLSRAEVAAIELKLHVTGEATDVSSTTNGATVMPPVGPQGTLTVRGSGSVNFATVQNGTGVFFLQPGQQSSNTAFYQFTDAGLGNVFNVDAGEIEFFIKSKYNLAARTGDQNGRRVWFEAYDASSRLFFMSLEKGAGTLLFYYNTGGTANTYFFLPVAEADTLFGLNQVLTVKLAWNGSQRSLYLNGVLRAQEGYTKAAPSWTSASSFVLGSTGLGDGYGGGFFANDEPIDDFKVWSAGGTADVTAPVVSNGQPTGTLPSSTTSTTLSVATDEPATCKFGTSSAPYPSLPSTFSTTGGTAHSSTISGLQPGTAYVYYVRCRDAALNANTADYVVSFSVANLDTQAPSAPTGLVATPFSFEAVDLQWNPSTDNVGVTGYRIRRDGAPVLVVPGTAFRDTGLQPNTTYRYRVTALDAAGNESALSNEAVATTLSTGPRTYYLSSQGNDSNTGTTPQSAFLTLARANQLQLQPGDRLLLEGGASFPGQLVIDDSGTPSQPIEVSSYPTANGTRAEILAGNGTGVLIRNCQHIRLSKMKVTGSGMATNAGYGIWLLHDDTNNVFLESIYLDDVETSFFGWAGISMEAKGSLNRGYRDVRVTHANSHDNVHAGMWTGICGGNWPDHPENYCYKDVYVGYSRFHNNPGFDSGTTAGTSSGNGLYFADVDGGVIEHCIAHDNGTLNRPDSGPVGLWAWWSNNVTIQFNESYNNRSQGGDGDGFDLDGGMTNSVMQYNYSHDNWGPGFLAYQFPDTFRPVSRNNVIRYNVSENDSLRGSYSGSITIGTDGVEVYGNTVYLDQRSPNTAAMFFWRGGPDVRIHNNIFMTTPGIRTIDNSLGAEVRFQGNDYWSGGGDLWIIWPGTQYSSLVNWRNNTGQEQLGGVNTGFQLDPGLTAPGTGGTIGDTDLMAAQLTGYRLTSGSLLRDRGLDLPSLGINPGSRDFYGNPIPRGGAFDIGAHETDGTPPPPDPNLLGNPSFETGESPWQQWWWTAVSPDNDFLRTGSSPRTGSWNAEHRDLAGGPLGQYSYQVVTGLQNGSYRLRGWVRTSGGLDEVAIGAKNFGASQQMAFSVPAASPTATYQMVELADIPVRNGQIEVFFWTYATSGGKWTTWEDFELVRQ